MAQDQVPGTCLLCGENTKFLTTHFAEKHSTHSYYPRGVRCPCGLVNSVIHISAHQKATPLCRLKYRDDATPPPREIPAPPTSTRVEVELPSPESRTAQWRRQYRKSDTRPESGLAARRVREAVETVTARNLPHQEQLHDLRTRDPEQAARTAKYVLLDETYGVQPARPPSEASTYTPSVLSDRGNGGGSSGSDIDSGRPDEDSESDSAADSDHSASGRRAGRNRLRQVYGKRRADDEHDARINDARVNAVRRRPSRSGSRRPGSPQLDDLMDQGANHGLHEAPDGDDPMPEVIYVPDSDEEPAQRRDAADDVEEYCAICMRVYGTYKDLYMHLRKTHAHVKAKDFTSRRLEACPCGRAVTLAGLKRHRDEICTLSGKERRRDAESGLEAKRRELYRTSGPTSRPVTARAGTASNSATPKNHNKKYPGTCNICGRDVNCLYQHLRGHEDRRLVPSDITSDTLEICRCGKPRGKTTMSILQHNKRCPYATDGCVSPPVRPEPERRPEPGRVSDARSSQRPGGQTTGQRAAGADNGSGIAPTCNICNKQPNLFYMHMYSHSKDRHLEPRDITADEWEVCRCGKVRGTSQKSITAHNKRCPYAPQARVPAVTEQRPATEQRRHSETDDVASPHGNSEPTTLKSTTIYYGADNRTKKLIPGHCNICKKRDIRNLYAHLWNSHRNRDLQPGDITADELAICRCGKAHGTSELGKHLHNMKCPHASSIRATEQRPSESAQSSASKRPLASVAREGSPSLALSDTVHKRRRIETPSDNGLDAAPVPPDEPTPSPVARLLDPSSAESKAARKAAEKERKRKKLERYEREAERLRRALLEDDDDDDDDAEVAASLSQQPTPSRIDRPTEKRQPKAARNESPVEAAEDVSYAPYATMPKSGDARAEHYRVSGKSVREDRPTNGRVKHRQASGRVPPMDDVDEDDLYVRERPVARRPSPRRRRPSRHDSDDSDVDFFTMSGRPKRPLQSQKTPEESDDREDEPRVGDAGRQPAVRRISRFITDKQNEWLLADPTRAEEFIRTTRGSFLEEEFQVKRRMLLKQAARVHGGRLGGGDPDQSFQRIKAAAEPVADAADESLLDESELEAALAKRHKHAKRVSQVHAKRYGARSATSSSRRDKDPAERSASSRHTAEGSHPVAEGSPQVAEPSTRKRRLDAEEAAFLLERRRYREQRSESPDGPDMSGLYEPSRPKKKGKKAKRERKLQRAERRRSLRERSRPDPEPDPDADAAGPSTVQSSRLRRRLVSPFNSPVPEQAKERRRVATTPVILIDDDEEPEPVRHPVPNGRVAETSASEEDPAPTTPPSSVEVSVSTSQSDPSPPSAGRRSAPRWTAINSVAEEDGEEEEEREADELLQPGVKAPARPFPPVPVEVRVSSQGTRMRLSGIDVPPLPTATRKRPRHTK